MKQLLLFFLIMGLIAGCASSKKSITDKSQQERTGNNLYDESFDPLGLDDDDIIITKAETYENESAGRENDKENSELKTSLNMKEVEGYRVQIIATKSIETATLVQQKASDQFKVMNYKAYLIFEAPLYKIRVGDALTRRDAEKIREIAKDYGYDQAFPVRSKVIVERIDETTDF